VEKPDSSLGRYYGLDWDSGYPWLMERHLKNTNMKSAVNDMSPLYEVEKPELSYEKVSARPTQVSRMLQSKRKNLEDMKSRLGEPKYYALRHMQTSTKKISASTKQERISQIGINDLCYQLQNLTTRNARIVSKRVTSLVKRIEKKAERSKKHFQEERWKRAQGDEPNDIDVDAFPMFRQNMFAQDTIPSFIPSAIDDKLKSYFACPHCHSNQECAVCLKAPMNHAYKCIEDIAIFMIEVVTYRDSQTFIAELFRIIKTMTGKALVTIDYFEFLMDTLTFISSLGSFSQKIIDKISDITSFADFTDFFSGLFAEKQAQALSDWMETDLFRVCSNWFSYFVYMLMSKGKCTNLPFLGDLMRATIDDGKRVSKDILKFTIKSIEFMLSKGRQCMEFGFMTTFYHSRSSYLDLVNRYELACKDFLCRGNPMIYKLDFHEYTCRLAKLRQDLHEMSQVGTINLRKEIQSMLVKVISMQNDIMSKETILQDRKAPFALLYWGNTSIGKNMFLELCYQLLCSVHDKPSGQEYKYTKNDDPRADGYQSHMHTMVFDDMGAKHDNKCPTGDPNVSMLIGTVNNVATITEQAVAEDKGKIPILVDFVHGTSNTEHFNAKYNLTYEAAARRRFNWYIHLTLKDDFATNGMFDHTRIKDKNNLDFWHIKCGKFMPGTGTNQTGGSVIYSEKFDNMADFYVWLAKVSKLHFVGQDVRAEALKALRQSTFCKMGHLTHQCTCVIQAKPTLPVVETSTSTTNAPLQAQGSEVMVSASLLTALAIGTIGKKIYDKGLINTSISTAKVASSVGGSACGAVSSVLSSVNGVVRSAESKCNSVNMASSILERVRGLSANTTTANIRELFAAAGSQLDTNLRENKMFLLKLGSLLALVFAGKKVFDYASKRVKSYGSKNYVEGFFDGYGECDEYTKEKMIPQGATMSAEVSKFWIDNANVLRDSDVGASSMFYKDKVFEMMKIVAANTVLMKCTLKNGACLDVRALCLGGWIYVTNYHYIQEREIAFIELIQDRTDGASANLKFKYNFEDAIVDDKRDLVYFSLKLNKPKKHLLNLFYRGDMNDTCLDGVYLARQNDGSIVQKPIQSVRPSVDNIHFKNGDMKSIKVFTGEIAIPSTVGDCGMPMILFSHYGPIIAGLHVTGLKNSVSATRLNLRIIDSMKLDFRPNLAPMKLVFDSASKVLIPERLVSHPSFLPVSASLIRYGSIEGGGSRVRSSVVRTEMAEELEKYGYKQLKTAPPLNDWRIFNKNLLEMTDKVTLVDITALNKCRDAYIKHISCLPQNEFDQVHVISWEVNINGMPGVDYIDKINRNTSAGFPWCRPKKKFLIPYSTPMYPDGVWCTPEMFDEVERLDYMVRTAHMTHSVFNTSQKDEPLPWEKVEKFGTRLFMGEAFPPVMINRKYYLSINRFFQRNRLECCMAVGIVAQSNQWGDIVSFLKWSQRVVAGDYSKFDKKQLVCMLHAAFDIMDYIAERSGNYTDIDKQAMLAQRCDIIYAVIHFDGDLVSFYGVLPSGVIMTVILNCLCNIMDLMYAYLKANPDGEIDSFFENVRLVTYGDDSVLSVNPLCEFYNHTTIQRELAKINITYTMAEKDRESVPFINLSEATFLKRAFVYSNKERIWLAPLEEENIVSSLMVWVFSKNLTPREQAYASMQNSIREFFFHGEQKYREMCVLYKEVYKCAYKTEIFLPTYEDLLESFHQLDDRREAQSGLEYSDIETSSVISDFNEMHFVSPAYSESECSETDLQWVRGIDLDIGKVSFNNLYLNNIFNVLAIEVPGIIELIQEYLGNKCLMHDCDNYSMCDEKLCCSHTREFELVFIQHESSARLCYACSMWYDTEMDVNPEICPICYCKYACSLCTESDLCEAHGLSRVIQTGVWSVGVIDEVLLPLMANPQMGDGAANKATYFLNYHRVMGLV